MAEAAEYLFGPFRVDVASLQLWKGTELVPLTPKAFDTLLVLIRHHHRVLRKDELLAAVWPNSFVSEDSLAQNITALRRSLGDDPNQPQYIATVPRRGYRFIAPVTQRSAASPKIAEAPPEPVAVAAAAVAAPAALSVPARPGWAGRLAVASIALGALAAAFVLGQRASTTASAQHPPLTFTVNAPRGTVLASGGVLSPDGKSIAFIAQDEASGAVRLWVRSLDTGVARLIEGTEDAARPFWSPDSQSLGFFAQGRLKRIDLAGGSPQVLASFVGLTSSGGSWSSSDTLLYANYKTGLWAVPASGGKAVEVTRLDTAALESAHRWPHFLPDGRHFLFSIVSEKPDHSGVFVASLDDPKPVKLLDEASAVYAAPGNLLFIRDRVLLAQPFDAGSLRLSGAPVPLATGVAPPSNNNNAVISGNADLLTFGGGSIELRLVWFDRNGTALEELKSPVALSNPTLSIDQSRLVAGSGTDVWLIDLERGAPTRLVPGNTPLQSPDGANIAYTNSRQTGIADIFVRPTAGPGRDDVLVRSNENKFVNDWSRDGRHVVFGSLNTQTKMDLWVVPPDKSGHAKPFLATPYNEFQAQLSPDGRWIAYASDESGTWEVYVQSFPTPGAKRAISSGGGSEPQWRGDGRELFYLAADGTLMSVDVLLGENLQVSRQRPLFRTPIPVSGEMYSRRNHYVPSTDGRRFLVNAPQNPEGAITMLVNWRARLGS